MLKAQSASPTVTTMLQRFKGGQPRKISSKHVLIKVKISMVGQKADVLKPTVGQYI